MSTLTQVEMSPCEYIYIRVVAETFLAVPAEITEFYLYALEFHFHLVLSFWMSPADTHGQEAAAGKINVLHACLLLF